jgi:hypothetical protein
MANSDLTNRFTFHPVSGPAQAALYEEVRAKALELALWLDSIAPDSRELSTAITKLDEVVFHTNAAIARHT